MFASIYPTLANTIRRIGRPQHGSEVINWFVDSRANVASDMPIPTRLSLPFTHWTKTTRALGVIAVALAGLVALLVYLGTKEKVVPSLNEKPEPSSSILPNSINVQDLRAVETRQLPQSPEGINVAVSATVEKNGNERVQCEAELLVNQHIIHQKYIHYWGYKTEAALMLPEGIARNEIWAYFAVPDDPYSENAAFRFDCNELSTAWLPISLRRGPPLERKK
jgi:hypothetical protein